MKRTAVVVLLVSVAGLAALLAWQAAVRQREFLRLMDEGDRALAADQTFPAVEAFSGAIALRTDSMIAHLRRGETYSRRGEMGNALRDLRTASRLDPAATRPLELLGDVNTALERYANAAESYEAFIRLDDRSPRVHYKLALARYRLGQAQTALRPLGQALALDGRFAAAYYLRGLCLLATNQAGDAATALERAVQLDPNLVAAREELAHVLTALHRDAEAATQLEALAAREPAKVERQVAAALASARAGRQDVAVSTLRRAAQDHPGAEIVYTAIGRIWLESAEAQGDSVAVNKALEALLPVVRRGSATSETLVLLGRAQLLAGDTGSAERSFRQATVRFPIEPSALLQLSLVAERNGHLATARDALARHIALVGDGLPSVERAIHLGDLSLRVREPAAAADWYDKAVAAANPPVIAFVKLAQAQRQLRNDRAAAATIERGLELEPRNPQLLALRREIQSGASR